MITLSSNIEITTDSQTYVIDFLNEVEIRSSMYSLSSTGSITFPKNVNWKDKNITDLIKRGDKVKIQLGYDGNLNTFTDFYITQITPYYPVKVFIEDGMFKLKQNNLKAKTFSKKNGNNKLKDILTYILAGTIYVTDYRFQDISPLNLVIQDGATTADVLEELKKAFGITSFIRDNKLYIGIQAYSELQKEVKFQFYKNIINFDNLIVKKATDTNVRVLAKSVDSRTNEVIAKSLQGASDGSQITLTFYDINQADLDSIAKSELQKVRYDGIFGTFTTFIEPFTMVQNKITLINDLIRDYNGSYICKSVNYSFGVNGGRQEIELGYKLG
jgi:hypothetical protein